MSERDLLIRCENWFRAALDGREGVDWLNGQSDKYPGDGWKHGEKLLADLRRELKLGNTGGSVFERKSRR